MASRQLKIIGGITGILIGVGVLIYVLLDEDSTTEKKKKQAPIPQDQAIIPRAEVELSPKDTKSKYVAAETTDRLEEVKTDSKAAHKEELFNFEPLQDEPVSTDYTETFQEAEIQSIPVTVETEIEEKVLLQSAVQEESKEELKEEVKEE